MFFHSNYLFTSEAIFKITVGGKQQVPSENLAGRALVSSTYKL